MRDPNGKAKAKNRGRRLRVIDKDALRRAVESAIALGFAGAARTTLANYRKGQSEEISGEVFEDLEFFLHTQESRSRRARDSSRAQRAQQALLLLDDAVLPTALRQLCEVDYNRWTEERASRWVSRSTPGLVHTGNAITTATKDHVPVHVRSALLDAPVPLPAVLPRRFGYELAWAASFGDVAGYGVLRLRELAALLDAIAEDEKASALLSKFCADLERWGIEPGRILVSIVRVVEPLLECAESGLLERGWREVRAAERLVPFLKHGFQRERMLLDGRDQPVRRLRRVFYPEKDPRDTATARAFSRTVLSAVPQAATSKRKR